MKKMLLLAVGAGLMSSMAFAIPVSCGGANTNDVTNILGDTLPDVQDCMAGNLIFQFFGASSVTPSSGITGVTIGLSNATVTSGAVLLDFQIGNLSGPGTTGANVSGDIILLYAVIGPTIGIDQNWGGTFFSGGGNVKILETACTTPYATPGAGCTGTTLATITGIITPGNTSFQQSALYNVDGVNVSSNLTYISKDIQYNQGNLSHFQNSSDIPEPLTLLLLGSGLVGLGFLRRRKSS